MSARDLPGHEARAAELFVELQAEFLAPPPRLTVTEWAEQHRILSGKDSAEPGPYRVSRTPYALEPQDMLSASSNVEEVVLMWGAQTSKTTIGSNWIGYIIDTQPGPAMIVQPTLDGAKRYSRQRLTPMIEESPRLKRKVRENRSRDEANTMLLKEYAGGYLAVAGANSAAGLRSMPIRDIYFDEVDGYPQDVDGEGDPITLAKARQTTFARRKRLITSTPLVKGFSKVEEAYFKSDQRQYHVACPHCGEHQVLEWGADKPWGVKWHKAADGTPLTDTAHYVCRHNGCEIEEHHKLVMLRCVQLGGTAEWRAGHPAGRNPGYQLNSLYSPLGWLSWREIAGEWLAARAAQAHGDHALMRAFVNTRLAETWEEQGDKISQHELAKRAVDRPMGVVPHGGLMLVQGIDTQPDRLERRVWAYGRDEASWLVDVEVIRGDPNLPEGADGSPWTRLTQICRAPVPHASGAELLIEATAIDTGGHNTQAVYGYCRDHAKANVLAIRGSPQPGRTPLGKPSLVDVNWRGKTIARSLKLWSLGTDTIKHLLYGRLRLNQPGPGYIDLPRAVTFTDELEQMTAERLGTKYVKGRPKLEWFTPPGKRNEALDCAVYAYAAACYLGLQSYREADWRRREERIVPPKPVQAPTPAPARAVSSEPATRRYYSKGIA